MRSSRRGQITIEFLFIFGLLTVLLLYSVKNTTFSEGTPSVENLQMQIAIEEKGLASTISNTINQVYAQGPGSKATTYFHPVYLRDSDYLKKAWGVQKPEVFITYGPYASLGNGTYVTVINGTGTTEITLAGGNKNAFWSRSFYSKELLGNSSVWNDPLGNTVQLKIGGSPATAVHGLILPADLPSTLKIVVEWNPDNPDRWEFDPTTGEIRININPGG